jgi:hypothetical protein
MNLLAAESFPLSHISIHRTMHRADRRNDLIPWEMERFPHYAQGLLRLLAFKYLSSLTVVPSQQARGLVQKGAYGH